MCRNKLGKKSTPKYQVFFLRTTSKCGHFVVITIYNLLFWELNFTNTKPACKCFLTENNTELQKAERVVHSLWDLSLSTIIKGGRWDKQISVIRTLQEGWDGKQNCLSFLSLENSNWAVCPHSRKMPWTGSGSCSSVYFRCQGSKAFTENYRGCKF